MLYMLTRDLPRFIVPDVNECQNEDNGGCNQTCVNTLGSYECACRTGFRLAADGMHCEGPYTMIHYTSKGPSQKYLETNEVKYFPLLP